ncbi:Elf4 domain-containing protein [Lactiplantibacillus plantarum]|uniref:Elf4 domain-containing protein n=1 Tax=Lactiplantibacillus plantarum TaxID=1590 RepID=UPI000B415DEE|nr:Elf4 domain-containing protein [Lactiplantibacillus plantarum]
MDNDKHALATDELATLPLDHNWYQTLASNFEILQQYLNKFDELADEVNSNQSLQSADLNKKLTDMQQQMNNKINRITLGTDEDTIRLVVTAILKEQGVIK